MLRKTVVLGRQAGDWPRTGDASTPVHQMQPGRVVDLPVRCAPRPLVPRGEGGAQQDGIVAQKGPAPRVGSEAPCVGAQRLGIVSLGIHGGG